MACFGCCEEPSDYAEQKRRLVSNDFLGEVIVPTQIVTSTPTNRNRDESVFTRLLDLSGRLSASLAKVLVTIFEEHCDHGIMGQNELARYFTILYPATHKKDGGVFVSKRSSHILNRWGIEYEMAVSSLSEESVAPNEIAQRKKKTGLSAGDHADNSGRMRPTVDSINLSYESETNDHLAVDERDEKESGNEEHDDYRLSSAVLDGAPPSYEATEKVLTLRRFLEYYHKCCHEHPMMVRIELVMLGFHDFRYNRLVDTRKSIDVLAYSVQQQRDLSAIYDDEQNRLDDGGQLVSLRAKEVFNFIQSHDEPFDVDVNRSNKRPNIYHKPLVWRPLRVCCPCCLPCIRCCGCCVT